MNLFESTFEKHKKLMLEKLSPELTQIQTKMSKIMNLPMGNAFVQYLQSAAKDPKVVQFLQAAKQDNATNDDAITVSGPTMLDVKNLRATQKEVFIGKSLEFPLKNKKFEQIKNFITTGQDAELNKSPIIVSGNFVIDGHHRWSQVFCWNKDAKIAAYDIRIDGVKNVEDVLKKMHLGVAATRGGLPLEDKPGAGNLFTMDDGAITKWLVMKILQYDAYQVFADPEVSSKMKSVIGNTSVNELTSKEDAESEQKKVQYIKTVVAPYICKNVADLKQNAGKFERKIMPQTGLDAQGKDANIQDFVKMMGSGNVNVDVTT
jgi:hypothetical protein